MEESVTVDLPVSTVHDQWTQFEIFPQFMEGVEEVRQLDDTHLHWKADILGVTREWDAEIVDQTPDERIGSRSSSRPVGARPAAGGVRSAPATSDRPADRPDRRDRPSAHEVA